MIPGFIFFGLIAIATGILSGLLGIGGNVLAVPAMFYVLKYCFAIPTTNAMYLTLGTCMTVMVFTSLSATIGHYKHKNINFKFFYKIIFYMIIAAILGVVCATMINGKILEKIFGAFLIFASISILFSKKTRHNEPVKELHLILSVLAGSFIGFCSGLLGIGGGSLLIPILIYLNYTGKMIAGTTSACSLAMAIVGTITFIIRGFGHPLDITYTIGYVYIPALVIMVPLTYYSAKQGVRLSMKVSNETLKRYFVVLLMCIGIYMLA